MTAPDVAAPARSLTAVWALLVAATLLSVGVHVLVGGVAALVVLLAVTFTKVWLVARYFMELRDAPALLRRLVDGYCVVVPVGLAVVLLVI